jgi:alpha-1,3-rhamnosyl/mannosyltransferase
MASLGIDRSSISVVHHGIDPSLFHLVDDSIQLDDIRKKYSLPEKFFLFVGTPHRRKNISLLVRSFAALSPAIAELLILLGPTGAHWPPETATCSRLRILSSVRRPDLAAIYSLSTGLVFPSLAEGFGYPVLEAMACGAPVICSSTTALPEVGGDAVCYIDPLDEESLKKALMRISTDRSYREQLSEAGMQRAKTMTVQQMGSNTINVYRKVLGLI